MINHGEHSAENPSSKNPTSNELIALKPALLMLNFHFNTYTDMWADLSFVAENGNELLIEHHGVNGWRIVVSELPDGFDRQVPSHTASVEKVKAYAIEWYKRQEAALAKET